MITRRIFKAKVELYSTDGENWTVDTTKVTEKVNIGRSFFYTKLNVKTALKEGDVLIRRQGKPRS